MAEGLKACCSRDDILDFGGTKPRFAAAGTPLQQQLAQGACFLRAEFDQLENDFASHKETVVSFYFGRITLKYPRPSAIDCRQVLLRGRRCSWPRPRFLALVDL